MPFETKWVSYAFLIFHLHFYGFYPTFTYYLKTKYMSYLLIVLARKEFVAKIQPFQTACVTQTITNVLVNSYVEKYKKVEIYPELVDQD